MRSQLLKVSALVLASALVAPLTFGQEEAEAEAPPPPTPQEIAAENLDQLLELVKQGQARASAENKAREDRFANDKANQAAALKRAEDERTREERRSARLEKQFEENELLIAAKQEQLRERLGTLSELFGHLTAASGDLASNVEVSLVSSEYPGRETFLKQLIAKMSGSDQLPSIEEIERVWFELLREIREQGEISRFTAQVATPSGELSQRDVVRVGAFNIVDTDGNYLSFNVDKLAELPRQPGGGFNSQAQALAGSQGGLTQFGIDPTGPTGGSFLAAIIDSPTISERWHQGGYV
ncbi:MAG: energy transducer TonB, partial [Halieaceae bacterium]